MSDYEEILSNSNPLGSGKIKIDKELIDRLKGKILLQVENHGEAWYLHPVENKRYFLGTPQAAFAIMQFLSLGITNEDIAQIEQGTTLLGKLFVNQSYGYSFNYPLSAKVNSNEYAVLDASQARYITVADTNIPTKSIFNVMLIPGLVGEIESYARTAWQINKSEPISGKEVGEFKKIILSSRLAYTFTVTQSYQDENLSLKLDEKNRFIFVKGNFIPGTSSKFIIWFPEKSEASNQILSTFKFIF